MLTRKGFFCLFLGKKRLCLNEADRMILEKRQRSPLFPDSRLGLFIQGNPGTTAIGRTFDCAVNAVKPKLLSPVVHGGYA
ncbi:hypothetical protein [Paenibacillus abyssi]|nr:hypothetical protein [Paenibacillus abyssi]